MLIPITEIFGPTIQGEGPNVGIKTLFVRVAGCDFNCSWCDSKFAWKVNENTNKYTSDSLANKVLKLCKETNTNHVILTGGNPCLYNFEEFINILIVNNVTVDIETQGSILPNWLDKCSTVVISPKAPSSKQKDVIGTIINWLTYTKCSNIVIKIPVFNNEDFEFAHKYYELVINNYKNVKLYLSVGNTDTSESGDISTRVLNDYKTLINTVMQSDMKDVYVLPQVHTLVWGNKQGV